MRSAAELESFLDGPKPADIGALEMAASYIQAGEEILENWITVHDGVPTQDKKEGFRILALQRQGSKGDASFNACRETARELVFHYNLIEQMLKQEQSEAVQADIKSALAMAELLAKHLVFFIGGKMQVAELGEFCCSSKSLRLKDEDILSTGVSHA